MSPSSVIRAVRIRVRAIGVFLVATVGFVGVYLIAVRTTGGQIVENRALETSTPETEWLGLLRLVSVENLAIAGAALLVLAMVTRRPDAALRVAAIMGLSNALTQVLKYHVLSRPDFLDSWADNTFPSGHTVAYASVLVSLVVVVPARARYLLALVVAVPMGIVSYQLLEYGWHRLSDVVGGLLLVTLLAALTFAVAPERRVQQRPAARRFSMAVLAASALGLSVGTAVLGGMVLLSEGLTDAGVLLAATELGTVATVCVMLLLVLLLQDGQRTRRPRRPTAADALHPKTRVVETRTESEPAPLQYATPQ